MPKSNTIYESKITDFSRGMTSDIRSKDIRECQLCKHFDNFSYKSKLVPYKDSEDAGWATQADTQLQSFLMYSNSMYALGIVSGFNYANIAKNTDMATPSWSSPTNGADSSGTTGFKLFIEYKGILYGSVPSASSGRIWSYNIAGTTFTASAKALNHTTIAQGLVHSKNDILYIGYDNLILRKNGAAAFEAAVLTLPTGFVISDLAEDGEYLAISGTLPNGKYMTFFWDMSATTWNDSIDWGEGTYSSTTNSTFIVEKLGGYLIGISIEGTVKPKLVFRKSYGGLQTKFKEIYITSGGIAGKQKYNNRIYFGLNASSVGGTNYDYTGIWSVGSDGEGGFSVIFDRLAKNDTLVESIGGFIIAQDYLYISYTISSAFELRKTNDSTSYTASSIYESVIFNGGDSSRKKKLIGVTVMTEYLPAAGQIVLKYKKDEETSWTTIFTEATDNSISHSSINIESSGATLPEFKEIRFQILSTGNAVITGLKFRYELIDKDIY